MRWPQAGPTPERVEKVGLELPDGVRLAGLADRSLPDLLAAGNIDCAITARPPDCFLAGHQDVVRLFRTSRSAGRSI